jgi:hypothetical protein
MQLNYRKLLEIEIEEISVDEKNEVKYKLGNGNKPHENIIYLVPLIIFLIFFSVSFGVISFLFFILGFIYFS